MLTVMGRVGAEQLQSPYTRFTPPRSFHTPHSISRHLHNRPVRYQLSSSPFYRWGNGGSDQVCDPSPGPHVLKLPTLILTRLPSHTYAAAGLPESGLSNVDVRFTPRAPCTEGLLALRLPFLPAARTLPAPSPSLLYVLSFRG